MNDSLSLSQIEVSEWPMEQLPHISATSMRMFKRCPEQYRRRYLLGEKVPPAANMIWGSADHAAIGYNLAQKIDTHEDLDVDTVMDFASEHWLAQLEEFGGVEQIDYGIHARELGEHPSRGDLELLDVRLRNEMIRLVALYHGQVCPNLQPERVEERFEYQIPGIPVPLVGYVDLETSREVRERKTAARADKTIKGDWLNQGRLYSAVTKKPVVWDVSLKAVKPKVVEAAYNLDYDLALADATLVGVRTTVESIAHCVVEYGLERPWPDALDHPWACSYCGWRDSCFWQGNGGA